MKKNTEAKLKKVNALLAKGESRNKALKKVGMAWATYYTASGTSRTGAATAGEVAQTDITTLEEIIRSNLSGATKMTLVRSLIR